MADIRMGQVVYVRIPGRDDPVRGTVVNIVQEIGSGPLYIVDVAGTRYPVQSGDIFPAPRGR